MAQEVLKILRRFALLSERRALAAVRARRKLTPPSRRLAKADTPESLADELARIIRVFGLQQAQSSAKRVGAEGVPDPYVQRLGRQSIFTAKRILAWTDEEITASVNRIIVEGMSETPPATVGDIAKRIREQYHGAGGAVGSVGEIDRTVRTGRTTQYSVDSGTMYSISSERAAAIAQTEIGEAEESGKVAGYEAIGVWGMKWLSRQWSQGRHQSMNGQVVKLGTKFRYPDGARGSYPRSPDSPVGHRVNCQCTTVPVFKE